MRGRRRRTASPTAKFVAALVGLTAVVLGVGAAAGVIVWTALDGDARSAAAAAVVARAPVLVLLAVLVAAAVAVALTVPFRRYVQPASRLEDAVRTLQHANPAHRPPPTGAPELRDLADAVTALADERDELRERVAARVREASADIDAERDRLAALVAQLPQAVVVANAEGQVLLYNPRAVELLGDAGAEGRRGGLGLGRSLDETLPRGPVAHALERASARADAGTATPTASTVVAADDGTLLRVHVTPVIGEEDEREGMVVTLEDVTEPLGAARRREDATRQLVEQVRGSVATVRAAIEMLRGHPEMSSADQDRFARIIDEEARQLSHALDAAEADTAERLDGGWLLEPTSVAELGAALGARLEAGGVPAQVDVPAEAVAVRADPHALVEALAAVVERADEVGDPRDVRVAAWQEAELVRLEVGWRGACPTPDVWQRWEEQEPLAPDGSTLKALVERHAGEVLHRVDGGRSVLRLLLPADEVAGTGDREPVAPRPEFYDFRLFRAPPAATELGDAPLGELACTVLDTETTGLRPDEGDEVVSVAAVRVVAGRVLRHERFARLVDPGRPVSPESVRIHGLSRELLAGRPTLAAVMGELVAFCADTVVVGHNVAFDLRFLERAAVRGAPRLDNPVLDTLLLSAIAYPSHTDHSLEGLADRLGVEVVGRHTALGDAMLTAEVFVRLLPLLTARGVGTVVEAQRASARTEAARAGVR